MPADGEENISELENKNNAREKKAPKMKTKAPYDKKNIKCDRPGLLRKVKQPMRKLDGDMRNWANPQIGDFEIWTKKGQFVIIKSGIPK